MAVCSVVLWIPILPWPQSEQQLRTAVEREAKDGIEGAIALMSLHRLDDFPPLWEPPPNFYRMEDGEVPDRLIDILEHCNETSTPLWVRDFYASRLLELKAIGDPSHGRRSFIWATSHGPTLDKLLAIVETLPDDSPLFLAHREEFETLLNPIDILGGPGNKEDHLTPDQISRMQRMLERMNERKP